MSTNHHSKTGSKAHSGQHSHHKKAHDEPDDAVLKPPAAPKSHKEESHAKAIELIRQKLDSIYGEEPDAKQEMAEAVVPHVRHSKHQKFMLELHKSGKPMAQIQAEWHQYYASLDDAEKHAVWQEFYKQSGKQHTAAKAHQKRVDPVYQPQLQAQQSQSGLNSMTAPVLPAGTAVPIAPAAAPPHPAVTPAVVPDTAAIYPMATADPLQAAQPISASAPPTPNPFYPVPQSQPEARTPVVDTQLPLETVPLTTPGSQPKPKNDPLDSAFDSAANDIRQLLRGKVEKRGKLQARHHLQSLLFGLGFGGLVLLVVLFSFFNEVFIAPFIQPSRSVSATPIIVSPDGVSASDKDEVLIPKINVQIPLDFSAKSTDEKEFEAALDRGVAHYPTTALPGQKGNASFFGHSSNNIFNPGQYKFAFVLLNELVEGDTFYINYKGTSYAYQVYDKRVVAATEVSILNPVPNKNATAMLVTCDPPGTSLRRLAVWGEQVSPNPNANVAAGTPAQPASQEVNAAAEALPGNGPTLWGRITNFITGD